ncbi:MAG: type IV secretory system conjugative DNA transfer family protein [Proteobacteria bacterium]|nr:MAG: type IV secretory system conjugative DNA transfer family protein [Pseudomonadota bacterium]
MNAPNWLKWLIGVVVFIAATVCVIWLAGFFFFVFSKANPFGKTDFWTWFTYWQAYQNDIVIAKRLKVSVLVSAVVAYGVPIAILIQSMRVVRSLHGEARFANAYEIKKAGLYGSTGIIIGKLKKRFLMFPGMQFVLLAAPTRSGKGVGIVIPNLLNWSESVVTLDVKIENFLITSKFRANWGQEIYLFNPFAIAEDAEGSPVNGRTHRYNPLGYISNDPRLRPTDILAIGQALYPGEGRDSFFDDAARNLFLGLTLFLCETPSMPRTIGELLRQSSGKGRPVKEHIQELIKARNYREVGDVMLNEIGEDRDRVVMAIMAITGISKADADKLCDEAPIVIAQDVPKADIENAERLMKSSGAAIETTLKFVPMADWDGVGLPPLSEECVDSLNRFTATSDNTLSSIMASFNVPLTLWTSPIIDAATSANDFDLRDIRKKRMSIYVGIPANKLAESKLLLNMFYTQLVYLNTNRLLHASPELKYTCLMLNDEFTAPGRIKVIDSANSFMAGYGLRMLNIIQSQGQLEAESPKGYGRENARTLVTNHACQIFFTPRDLRDANEYSESLGFYTFKAKGKSRQLDGKTSRSESESDQKRALMMPQELKDMTQREQIVNLENTKAIHCEKINYYSDHIFINRLKSVSPSLKKLGKKLPTKSELETAWGSGECAVEIPLLNLDLHDAIVQKRTRDLTVSDVVKGIDLSMLAVDLSKVPFPASEDMEPEECEAFVKGFFDALDLVNEYDEVESAEIEIPEDTEPLNMLSEDESMTTAIIPVEMLVDIEADPPAAGRDQDAFKAPRKQKAKLKDVSATKEPKAKVSKAAKAAFDTTSPEETLNQLQGTSVKKGKQKSKARRALKSDAEIISVEPSDEELAQIMDDETFYDDGFMQEKQALLAFEEMQEIPEYSGDEETDSRAIDLSVLNKPPQLHKNAARI